MPKYSQSPKEVLFTLCEDFMKKITHLDSKRPVRPVVTRTGQRARGNFPSIKASTTCRFESLVERDLERTCEVSTLVKHMASHRYVLALKVDGVVMHYTPDLEVRLEKHSLLIEAKGSFFLETIEQRDRLKKIIKALRTEGVHFVVVVESDVRLPGFQEELEELLLNRPVVPRHRPGLNKDHFDPLGRTSTQPELEKRWANAQHECDALLKKLMRRDPDEFVSSFNK